MNAQFTIDFEIKRCYECGTWWAIEGGRHQNSDLCPRCGGEKVQKAHEQADTLERSARSLRAYINRKRKK